MSRRGPLSRRTMLKAGAAALTAAALPAWAREPQNV